MTVTIGRESVCFADDVDCPNERTFELGSEPTLADLIAAMVEQRYLPEIMNGRAT